jgi:hypothetical protein
MKRFGLLRNLSHEKDSPVNRRVFFLKRNQNKILIAVLDALVVDEVPEVLGVGAALSLE